jgi:tryptophan synthase alpha chain
MKIPQLIWPTGMNSIEQLFSDLRTDGRRALMPFLAAGDPNLEFTQMLLGAFEEEGCHLCELGFPYSDPIADGPTIQAAFTRALANGVSVEQIFQALKSTSARPPTVAMLSYAIVHRWGLAQFVGQAAEAGFAGLIVPDLPIEESQELGSICRARNLSLIQLVTPTTNRERAKRIVEAASGFIYYVSVAGVTGQRTDLPPEIVDNLASLKELTDLPICVGFGISSPAHVRSLAPHCDGLIVGSAIVRRIEQGLATQRSAAEIVTEIRAFCRELLEAMPGAR